MKRFELIDALEGRFLPTPKGDWLLVQNGQIQTEYGPANLMQFSAGVLEQMYLKSRSDLVREANLWLAALRPHFTSEQLSIGMVADMVGRQYTQENNA